MLKLAVVVLLAACTDACCSPLQWEMDGGKVAAHIGGAPLSLSMTNCRFHYDAVNLRVAMTMGIFRDPNFKNKTIWDYQNHLMYSIDEIRDVCDVMYLDRPFQKICTPEDARVADHFFYGGGDQRRLPAATFEYDRPAYSGFVKITEGTEATDTCVPIISVDYNLSMMVFMTFENIVNGIQNPSVFIPPAICHKSIKREMNKRAHFHSYLRVPMMLGQ